jgi:hypothetical protein
LRSADWSERKTSINLAQAHIDADGRFRCVVSHRDPGVPNWLDTGGLAEGMLQYRWIWSNDNPLPTLPTLPTLPRLAFDVLGGHLPAATPQVCGADRAAELVVRRRHRALREPAS